MMQSDLVSALVVGVLLILTVAGCNPSAAMTKGPAQTALDAAARAALCTGSQARYRRRRIVGVKHRVVFGPVATIESILAKRG